MAGESQQPPTGSPDPTVLTTEALTRGLSSERDYTNAQLAIRDERLRGIDVATQLLNETVNRVPTDVQKEVSHLRELTFERMASADRALQALRESIALQFEANGQAIGKSEAQQIDSTAKLGELVKSTTDALANQISDNKDSVAALALDLKQTRAGNLGGASVRAAIFAGCIAVASVILAAIGIGLAIALR